METTLGPDAVVELLAHLQASRERVVGALDGLSERDVRRPMTASGTNLLGLVKHLLSCEVAYFGDSVGRPLDPPLPWYADGSVWENADMWARPEESREHLVGLYRATWARSDAAIAELGPAHPSSVAWWPQERRRTTLGRLLVRVALDTAQHAGHADILRELLAGRGADHEYSDDAQWTAHVARIQEAADGFA
jgi:hypothetical protein